MQHYNTGRFVRGVWRWERGGGGYCWSQTLLTDRWPSSKELANIFGISFVCVAHNVARHVPTADHGIDRRVEHAS